MLEYSMTYWACLSKRFCFIARSASTSSSFSPSLAGGNGSVGAAHVVITDAIAAIPPLKFLRDSIP